MSQLTDCVIQTMYFSSRADEISVRRKVFVNIINLVNSISTLTMSSFNTMKDNAFGCVLMQSSEHT